MQSTKWYHGLTIMFNLKTLRLIVDLGLLKVSLAFAKSICPLSLQKFLNAWHLILLTIFLFSLYNVYPHQFPRNIEAASVTLFIVCEERSVVINWDQIIVLSISVYNFRYIISIQLIGHDI